MKRTETNMKKVKEMALCLLHLPIPKGEFYPIVVSHPFFSSTIIPKEGFAFLNLEDEKDLAEATDMWKKIIEKAKSYHEICMYMNKPYRLTFLKFCENYLSEEDFTVSLAENWVLSENPNQDKNVSRKKFISWFRKADKKLLMEEEDYEVYKNIPETITLYRGVCDSHARLGLSWTASYEKAKWFASRWNSKNGYILKVTVSSEDILCYLNTRNEDEYVLDVFKYKNKIEKLEN